MSQEIAKIEEIDEDEVFEDETYLERLVALEGAFPSAIKYPIAKTYSATAWVAGGLLTYGSKFMWYATTSSMFLVIPYSLLGILDADGEAQLKQVQAQQDQEALLLNGPTGGVPAPPTN